MQQLRCQVTYAKYGVQDTQTAAPYTNSRKYGQQSALESKNESCWISSEVLKQDTPRKRAKSDPSHPLHKHKGNRDNVHVDNFERVRKAKSNIRLQTENPL